MVPDVNVGKILVLTGYLKSFIMTNLTRLRLILVDLSGLMKKKTYLKQNVLFVNPFPSDFFP